MGCALSADRKRVGALLGEAVQIAERYGMAGLHRKALDLLQLNR